MKKKLKELKAQARELIALGDSREKAQGLGMMRVIKAIQNKIRKSSEPKISPKEIEDFQREIGIVSSIVHESYFEELRQKEGSFYAHDQIGNIAPAIAKETIIVPLDKWEERKEDFESYVVRRARELFKTIDIKVEKF